MSVFVFTILFGNLEGQFDVDVRFFMGWMLYNVFTSHNIYVMSNES